MARRKRDVAIIVLKCAFIGLYADDRQAAFGTEMVAAGDHVTLVQPDASASQVAGSLEVQETKNADAQAEPQAVMREIKSVGRLLGSKQRRRKPKMAGVPAGSQAVAQETEEPGQQAETGSLATKEAVSGAVAAKEAVSGAVAQETEEIDIPVAEATAGTEPRVKGPKAASAGKKKYGMAPVKWGVRLTDTVSLERHSQTFNFINTSGSNPTGAPNSLSGNSQSRGLVHTQSAELGANTYIMQPYIAQLDGRLGVNSSKNTNSSNGANSTYSINGLTNDSLRTNQLFGNGVLSLFSQSRFPFNMSLLVKDSRNNDGFTINDSVGSNLHLNQSYSPLNGTSWYNINYSREAYSTIPIGVAPDPTNTTLTAHSAWRGVYSMLSDEHRINVNTAINDKTTTVSNYNSNNVKNRIDSFLAQDKYLPEDSLLSLNSAADLYSSSDMNSIDRYLQVYTNATWQPEDEDLPLFLDGSVHLFGAMNKNIATLPESTQSVQSTSTQSLSGNIGARYIFSRNLSGRIDGDVTGTVVTDTNSAKSLITTQSGIINYSSDVIKLWKNSSWSWNANGGATNQTFSGNNNADKGYEDRSILGGIGQGLSVLSSASMFGRKWKISSTFDQSLGANIDRVNGPSGTLASNGRVTVTTDVLAGKSNEYMQSNVSTRAGLSVSDRYTLRSKVLLHTRFYALDLGLQEMGRTAYNRDGLAVEASVGAVQGTSGRSIALVGSSTVKYDKSRIFGVRGLDYTGALRISGQSSQNSRDNGAVDPNSVNPRYPWSLEQMLIYRIGQNELLLKELVSDQQGVKDNSLWLVFRAWRTVGGTWR